MLTTADEINIEVVCFLEELQNMQPGTPSLACSQNVCEVMLMPVFLRMSCGDYNCHRTRNIGLCLKWNEGGAVRV